MAGGLAVTGPTEGRVGRDLEGADCGIEIADLGFDAGGRHSWEMLALYVVFDWVLRILEADVQ